MKRFLALLATGALAIGLSTSAQAQTRAIGAGALVLDDLQSPPHTLTITAPVFGSTEWLNWQSLGFPPLTWTAPIPPAAGVQSGFVFSGPSTGSVVPHIAYWVPPSQAGYNHNGGIAGAWDYATAAQLGLLAGSGTANTITKWNGAGTTVINSSLTDDGTSISTLEPITAAGLTAATGNVNAVGGTLQTNTVSRIDNSGNLPNTGDITFTNTADHSIAVTQTAAGLPGKNVSISAGSTVSGSAVGGTLSLSSGAGGPAGGASGPLSLATGTAVSSNSGSVTLSSGAAGSSSGNVTIATGTSGVAFPAGSVSITPGTSPAGNGAITMTTGGIARLGIAGTGAVTVNTAGTASTSIGNSTGGVTVSGNMGIGTTPSSNVRLVVQGVTGSQSGAVISNTDIAGSSMPLVVLQNTTGLTYGTAGGNTEGRMIRMQDASAGSRVFDLGINQGGDWFLGANDGINNQLIRASTAGVITFPQSAYTTNGVAHFTGSTGTIASSLIVDADVSASAAIAGSKINPAFGAQVVSTSSGVSLTGAAATLNLNGSVGSLGDVLTSAGAGATPTWTPASGAFIQNQFVGAQTSSNFWISGNGRIGGNAVVDGTTSLNGNVALGDNVAADFTTFGSTITGATPLVFDGLTVDANKTTFAITNPTAARTITFPDASGTVALGASMPTGTTTDATLRWNGANWVENTTVLANSTGGATFGKVGSAGSLSLADGAGFASTPITWTVAAGFNLGAASLANVGGITAAGTISLNDNAAANTTSIGGGTTTGAVAIGGANTVSIQTSGQTNIGRVAGALVNIGNGVNSGQVDIEVAQATQAIINNGANSGKTYIGAGGAAGSGSVYIGTRDGNNVEINNVAGTASTKIAATGNTGTVEVGNTGTTSNTILGAAVNVNNSGTGTTTIGNTSGGAVGIASASTITLNGAAVLNGQAVGSSGAIGDNVTVYDVTDNGVGSVTLSVTTAPDGRVLIIHNGDADATAGIAVIPPTETWQLVRINGSWRRIN